jgi:hypothetical protein
LLTKFKSNTKKIFLDPLSEAPKNLLKGEKLALILSPSLYWVRKVSLPVRSVRELVKLLPSVFEEFLPEGDYSYTAYKQDHEYIAFAYEDKKILKAIRNKGINSADIAGVYFAQSAFSSLEKPMKINDTQVLYEKDSILSLAPLSWAQDFEELSLNNLNLSKHKLQLQFFSTLVDQKSLYKIAGLLLVLIFVLFVEVLVSSSKVDEINTAKEELFAKYKLQSTMMQNKSSLKHYTKVYNQQKKFREEMKNILARKLAPSQSINYISYKNGVLEFKTEENKQ